MPVSGSSSFQWRSSLFLNELTDDGWGVNNMLWQLVPMIDDPVAEKVLPDM